MGGAGGFGGGTAGGPDAGMFPNGTRASRSSSIALSRAGWRVAVNPDLSLVAVTFQNGVAGAGAFNILPAGSAPSAIALLPNDTSAVVALRKSQELAFVTGLPAAPVLAWRVPVCSEPTGVALSPSGRTAVVACFGEPMAVLVDTVTRVTQRIRLPGVARAVAVTNDGDADDADERALLPLFYGVSLAEGSDTGRVGKVVELDLGTRAITATITLSPIADQGFGPDVSGVEGPHVACAPNQLSAIAIAENRAWVTHTCVSPQPPLYKLTTLASAISVIDLNSRTEITGFFGSVTLSTLVRQNNVPNDSLLGSVVDLDVDPRGGRAVVLSQGANSVAFLNVAPNRPISVMPGPMMQSSVSLGIGPCAYPNPCADGGVGPGPMGLVDGVPIGVVLFGPDMVSVNDWTGRSIIDANQFIGGMAALNYAPAPPVGTRERSELVGKRFFFTAVDRWSFRDVGSCGSCHPDGLSDNVTWVFPAGPRQTPSLDGTFAKGDPTDHRAQNWTAIFDEIYDVEGVTRNVLGGKGAITSGPVPMDTPISLSAGISLDGGAFHRNDNLSGSSKAVSDTLSGLHDWADIEAYVQTIEPNRAPLWPDDPGAAQRGRTVFSTAGCAACHGGPKWTTSRVPYLPSPAKNGSLPGDNNLPAVATGLRTELRDGGDWLAVNRDTFKVAVEKNANPDGGATLNVGPERITCVLRDVGTFDPANPLEKKADGTRAQGGMGFNPPSLLGLATSAPYFHHGEATTLADVFKPKYAAHHQAAAPGFLAQGGTTAAEAQQLRDLVVFLQSIDETTLPFAASTTVDLCGGY